MEDTNCINIAGQSGVLNGFKNYRQEYIETLEALVQTQKELIEALRKSQVVITSPVAQPTVNPFVNPFVPYMPTITCGGTAGDGPTGVMSYNSGDIPQNSMGPEYAG